MIVSQFYQSKGILLIAVLLVTVTLCIWAIFFSDLAQESQNPKTIRVTVDMADVLEHEAITAKRHPDNPTLPPLDRRKKTKDRYQLPKLPTTPGLVFIESEELKEIIDKADTLIAETEQLIKGLKLPAQAVTAKSEEIDLQTQEKMNKLQEHIDDLKEKPI